MSQNICSNCGKEFESKTYYKNGKRSGNHKQCNKCRNEKNQKNLKRKRSVEDKEKDEINDSLSNYRENNRNNENKERDSIINSLLVNEIQGEKDYSKIDENKMEIKYKSLHSIPKFICPRPFNKKIV
jgi:hypothetical protein